jgi:hypothetical protein
MKERQRLTYADVLTRETGPTLTPYDVARISQQAECPICHETVRRACERGDVVGVKYERSVRSYEWRIAFVEAKRYLLKRCGPLKMNVPRENTTQSTHSHTVI